MKPASLNPRERLGLFLIDERPDRLPVIPLITSHAAKIAGITVREYCTLGEKMAQAHLASYKRYTHDSICLFSDVGMVAESYGSQYYFAENDIPTLEDAALEDVEQAGELEIPQNGTPGRWGVYYDAIEKTYNAVGDRVPITCFVPAPFTTAAGIRGTEDFLVDLMIDPESSHVVLRKAEEGVIRLLDEVMLRGALPLLVDPLASASVISPDQFAEFALPYIERCIAFLHRYDMDVILHICGKTAPILDKIPDTSADLFSMDDTDLHETCTTLGGDIRIIGNIRPADILQWTPDEVATATRDALKVAKDNPKGFVMSTGCEVPLMTPEENIDAMIRTVHEEGKYW